MNYAKVATALLALGVGSACVTTSDLERYREADAVSSERFAELYTCRARLDETRDALAQVRQEMMQDRFLLRRQLNIERRPTTTLDITDWETFHRLIPPGGSVRVFPDRSADRLIEIFPEGEKQ